jgi:hypothetical protein
MFELSFSKLKKHEIYEMSIAFLFHVLLKSRDMKMGARSSFVLFVVLSCPEVKQSRNFYPIPFHVEVTGGAFLAPYKATFSIILYHPTPNSM